jgi:hypothetical protein
MQGMQHRFSLQQNLPKLTMIFDFFISRSRKDAKRIDSWLARCYVLNIFFYNLAPLRLGERMVL